MSGRGSKKRGRPPKTSGESPKKFQMHLLKKPKYLQQKGIDSQLSTPSASRASSPLESEGSSRKSLSRPSTSRTSMRGRAKGRNANAAANTSYNKRGYNTSAYHESEYHYGSDFGDSSDSKSDNEDENILSPALSEESLNGNESDNSDFSMTSYASLYGKNGSGDARPSTPNPLWLQNENLPPLELPPSSDDLMVPSNLSLKVTSIYEVMRRFRNLVRLSPFRLEDFCAAVVYEDQSALLTEIHIMLLKAILREEDSQQTHFGPLDQKDSFNIALYLIDNITWPEVLRCYVESDILFDEHVLNILTLQEYPYVSVEERLTVLQFLTDQFLITTIVRDDLLQEGPIHYDDHCRICHRLGDLLCCETCPAVFHLECVDPPLDNVPTEDWQCNICKSHKVVGVADCVSRLEKMGTLCRQEPLGFDRHGRKYWFVARRLFVESDDALEINYYSTTEQLDLLLTLLDNNLMETELCRAINEIKSELIRQMQITESLTNQLKGNKKSYFEIQNARVADMKEKILAEKTVEDAEMVALGSEKDSQIEGSSAIDTSNPDVIESAVCDHGNVESVNTEEQIDKNIETLSTTGSMTAKAYIAEKLKRKSRILSILAAAKEEATAETQSTRSKSLQLANGTLHYKLGMENAFRNYINQFSVNPIALNKPQRNEERDKKRHLSHKFSLTPASEFKWMGVQINMTKTNMIATLKQTLIGFDQNIATQFMHPNWPKLRKTWLNTVSTCNTPREFSRALIVFHACLKSVVYANVWHEQLGHLKLYRITASEREDKKKLEKREKREREDEEERNRLAYNFVKYSLGLKHQVWKQKGEEYRIHGQWGWIWMSATRRQKVSAASVLIVPQKIMLRVKHQKTEKIISVDPNTHQYLLKTCKKDLISVGNESNEQEMPPELKDIELFPIVTTFDGIDISRALTTSGRLLYPKISKRSKLNDLLSRRIQLRELEEKSFGLLATQTEDIQSSTSVDDNKKTTSPLSSESTSSGNQVKSPNNPQIISSDLSTALVNRIQTVRVKYGHLNRLGKQYTCYSRSCTSNSSVISLPVVNNCYSPLCIQKTRIKTELLLLIKKAQTDGLMTKEQLTSLTSSQKKPPSILEQKLSEGKTAIEDRSLESYNIFSCVSFEDPRAIVTKDLNDAIDKSYDCDESFLESCLLVDEPSPECIKIEEQKSSEQQEPSHNAIDNVAEIKNSEKLVKVEDKSSTVTETQNNDENDKLMSEGAVTPRRPGRPPRKTRAVVDNTDTQSLDDKKDLTSLGIFVPHRINRRFAFISKTLKTDDPFKIEKEYAPNGSERVYSATSTAGKIYLKKAVDFSEKSMPVKIPQINKFPVVGNFDTKKGIKSILALPLHDLNKLARSSGRLSINGFHHLAKNNPTIWNYPCSRPLFKTCWLFRCIKIKTLSAIALQLRILWTCLRWDDMATRPQNSDGKHQITTETEIMSSELLKHQFVGKFLEKTQYLRRKVVIPLELPKTIREVTSIRSGLRKRKRAESPQHTEPQVTEEWIDEDKLELWEIRQYGERQERINAQQHVTRTSTGKLPLNKADTTDFKDASAGQQAQNSKTVNLKQTPEEIKEKMEQQLKIQRAAHHQKRQMEMKQGTGVSPTIKNVIQKRIMVKNADGTTKIIHQTITQTGGQSQPSVSQPPQPTTSQSAKQDSQKVQIIRGPDGKVSVRGLMPGQQLIQTPDGKLHVLNSPQVNQSQAPTSKGPVQCPKTTKDATIVQKTIISKPVIQQSVQQTGQMVDSGSKSATVVIRNPSTKQQIGTKIIQQKQAVQKIIQPGPSTSIQTESNPQTIAKLQLQNVTGTNVSTNVQKLLTSGAQIITTPTNTGQKIISTSNIQHLLSQQKIVVSPAVSQVQKVLVAAPNVQDSQKVQIVRGQEVQSQPQQATFHNSVGKQIIIQQNSGQQPQQQQQHLIIKQGNSGQKILQQLVSPQQLIVGGQRIILSPSQRIVQSQPQQQVQQIFQQQPQQVIMRQQPQVLQQPVQTQSNQQQTTQIVVQNQNLAHQIATGKVQMTTINGQQVFVRQENGNLEIVATIKHQTNGPAQVIPTQEIGMVSNNSPESPVNGQQQQIQQQMLQPKSILQRSSQQIQAPVQPPQPTSTLAIDSNNQVSPSIEQSLLQGQPPGTVIKCVTAQVIQTQNGPRIVLQGLQGSEFTQQQSALVQQQVKQQLLKAQESNGKQGVLGPTKIYLAIQPAQPQAQPPPLAPVQQITTTTTTTATTIITDNKRGIGSIKLMKDLKTTPSNIYCSSDTTKKGMMPIESTNIDNDEIVHSEVVETNLDEQGEEHEPCDSSFIITPDYIQQTIKNALKQENLNPEIEEKLLNLQRYQEKQMKTEQCTSGQVPIFSQDIVTHQSCSHSHQQSQYNEDIDSDDTITEQVSGHPSRKRKSEIDDDEWCMDTPRKRATTKSYSSSANPHYQSENVYVGGNQSAISNVVFKTSNFVNYPNTDVVPPKKTTKSIYEKKKFFSQKPNKLQTQLNRQKEQLKKEILRKRLYLEKELQLEIKKELEREMIARTKQERMLQDMNAQQSTSRKYISKKKSLGQLSLEKHKTSKKQDEPKASTNIGLAETSGNSDKLKVRKTATKSHTSNRTSKRKEKLYCICQTPYDDRKFYVGCDLCNNWFHGECVNITEEASKKLSEFICTECKHARDTKELYCLCKQPYDESQFYICCDKCQDWFHGRCVGILQSEADSIDEYICPNCQQNNAVNFANMKSLSQHEFSNLKILIKQIQADKHAWPFMEPVDPEEAPDYYKVIKDPMDLQKIETKIDTQMYRNLSEFIADVTKVFDNCRYYNPKDSSFYRCAESLEANFVQKIKHFRENLVDNTSKFET